MTDTQEAILLKAAQSQIQQREQAINSQQALRSQDIEGLRLRNLQSQEIVANKAQLQQYQQQMQEGIASQAKAQEATARINALIEQSQMNYPTSLNASYERKVAEEFQASGLGTYEQGKEYYRNQIQSGSPYQQVDSGITKYTNVPPQINIPRYGIGDVSYRAGSPIKSVSDIPFIKYAPQVEQPAQVTQIKTIPIPETFKSIINQPQVNLKQTISGVPTIKPLQPLSTLTPTDTSFGSKAKMASQVYGLSAQQEIKARDEYLQQLKRDIATTKSSFFYYNPITGKLQATEPSTLAGEFVSSFIPSTTKEYALAAVTLPLAVESRAVGTGLSILGIAQGTQMVFNPEAPLGERIAGGFFAGLGGLGLASEARAINAERTLRQFKEAPLIINPKSYRLEAGNQILDIIKVEQRLPRGKTFEVSIKQPSTILDTGDLALGEGEVFSTFTKSKPIGGTDVIKKRFEVLGGKVQVYGEPTLVSTKAVEGLKVIQPMTDISSSAGRLKIQELSTAKYNVQKFGRVVEGKGNIFSSLNKPERVYFGGVGSEIAGEGSLSKLRIATGELTGITKVSPAKVKFVPNVYGDIRVIKVPVKQPELATESFMFKRGTATNKDISKLPFAERQVSLIEKRELAKVQKPEQPMFTFTNEEPSAVIEPQPQVQLQEVKPIEEVKLKPSAPAPSYISAVVDKALEKTITIPKSQGLPTTLFKSKVVPTTMSLVSQQEKLRLEQVPLVKTMQVERQDQTTFQLPTTKSLQLQQPRELQLTPQIVSQLPMQNQRSEERQVMRLNERQLQAQSNRFGIPSLFKTTTGKPPKTKLALAQLKRKAYSVYVRRKGKFFEVGKGLPKGKAEQLGSKVALTTLARTFAIKEMGTTNLEDIGYQPSQQTFRQPKKRIAGFEEAFVQRVALSRGTGEVREIQAFKRSKSRGKKLFKL